MRGARRGVLTRFVEYKRFGRFKQLLDRPVPAPRPTFPKLIHLYWDSGFDNAPEITRSCVASWQTMNPGWKVRLWSGRPFADFPVPADIRIQHYSDLLRMKLLREHGGVWADATTECRVPLDHWLPLVMSHADFFAFSTPGADRPIANWFLAARPSSLILEQLWRESRRFWEGRSTATKIYHWQQYVFDYLLRTSRSFRREWAATPQISAAPSLPGWTGELVAAVLKFSHKRQASAPSVERGG